MSKPALAIALLLLIALSGAGIILMTRPAAPVTSVVPLLPTIQPERVQRLSIDDETFTRDGTTWRGMDGWPVRTDRVRNLLRALSGLEGESSETAEPTDPVSITLAMTDGTQHALTIDRRALAGETVAHKDGASVVVSGALLSLLPETNDPWRTTAALPGFDPQRLARVRLSEGGDGEISVPRFDLQRISGSWGATIDGTSVRVNPTAVRALGERFRSIEFVPSPNGSDAYPTVVAPTRMIFTMSRTDPEAEPDEYRIALHHSTLPGTDDRPARVSIPGGTAFGVATGLDPDDLPFDVFVYLARNASGVLSTDVRTIEIDTPDGAPRRYERDLERWAAEREGETLPAGDAEQLLQSLITSEGVPGRASDAEFLPLVTIRLFGFDEGLLETVEAGFVANNVFAYRQGPVLWAYPRAEAPRVLRLVPPSDG